MATAYLRLSWEEIAADSRALAGRLRADAPYRGLIAITRGGLVPAAILACELGLKLIETIGISSYQGEHAQAPLLLKPQAITADGEGFIVVDDLVDSGATMLMLRDMLPKARHVVLYAKPDGEALADMFVRKVPQDTWIVFPWDPA